MRCRFRVRVVTLALLALVAWAPAGAAERPEIIVTDPTAQRFRAAVQRFASLDGEAGATNAAVLREQIGNALEYSNLFQAMDAEAFVGGEVTVSLDGDAPFVCSDWKQIGADVLIEGEVSGAGGELLVEYRVRDVSRCKSLRRRRYRGSRAQGKRIAARIADDVVEALTGRAGVASTKIAFISNRTGNKELYVMDADGGEVVAVTRNGSINTFPAWSPDAQSLLYTSYRSLSKPGLFLVKRGGGSPGQVFAGLGGGGAQYRAVFSPDGKRVAMVASVDGAAEIFSVRRNGRGLRRLTRHPAIDIGPSWSPDGKRIAFVSDRGGTPQVYVMDADGDHVRRITFQGEYNTAPAWSPDGHWIAYESRVGGQFDIWLVDPAGVSSVPLVTHRRSDESPSWSPDGRMLAFTSNRRGRYDIYSVDVNGTNLQRVTSGSGDSTNPAWGPYER